jgi:hypothetical protein
VNHDDTNPNAPTDPEGRMWGMPLDTPLDREPDALKAEAGEMLRIALLHVGVLSGWDHMIARWLLGDDKDGGTIAIVASWLHRAYQSGVEEGRSQVLAETSDLDPAALAADIERLADHDDDLPGHPVRSVVLPQPDAARLCDFLEVPEEGHRVRVQWAHREDGLIDVRISPADYTHLQDADDDGPYIGEDGMLTVPGARYELTVGWPRRDADAQVDQMRGYDGTDGDAETTT